MCLCGVKEPITLHIVTMQDAVQVSLHVFYRNLHFLLVNLLGDGADMDRNSVYLTTKKIGKNNPKAAEIKADNATRQDWNRIADTALVSGIAEAKIIELKNEHVYNEATPFVQKHGWLPGLFRGIIQKAKEILMGLIR